MLIKNIKIWVTKDTQKYDFLKKCMFPDLLLYTIWKLRLRASKWCATRPWDFLWPKRRNHLYVEKAYHPNPKLYAFLGAEHTKNKLSSGLLDKSVALR